ncbi:uncharacterized protein LOC131627446 [Vicia villosa]|uniref:uncharacterized protein LOC131627446 n=1 Tax=Vicia villosa TaxID=3911 RepID=UPI00273B81E1|nr:uncharacterized protein LOC131627446 [Vicia villosa]
MYSVRSGYRLWREAQVKHLPGGVEENWSSLWNIKAPPRVKYLLWRICRGCLPTRLRLQQFHVQCPSGCQFCEDNIEDDCWEDRKTVGRVAVMLDVLWRNRNNKLWNNENEEAITLGLVALSNWQAWFAAQQDHNTDNPTQFPTRWEAPNVGWLKCNVDAGTAWDIGTQSILEAEALALKEAIQGAII